MIKIFQPDWTGIYITLWSYGIDETMNLLVPNFKGGSSKPFDNDSETVKGLKTEQRRIGGKTRSMKYWEPSLGLMALITWGQ